MSNRDEAQEWTEERLKRLEKRIEEVYREAMEARDKSVDAFFAWFEKADEKKRKLLEEEKITEKQYQQWRLEQLMTGNQYKAMRDKLAARMTHANEIAIAYVNDETPGIYSINRNWTAYKIEQAVGDCDFTLYDERVIKRLIMENPELMPNYPAEKAIKRDIDLEYGKKQITSSITSGILQGRPIDEIAQDLMIRISGMNKNSAIRAARTATTGAQNAGRLDGYNAAAERGIKLKKQWLATLDGRTRHSHAALDGATVDRDKKFDNGCMYPGDPNGRPEEIYNCRCTMIAVLGDEPYENAQRRARSEATGKNYIISDMTYKEWEKWKTEKADSGLYSRYKAILGDIIPNSIDEFKNIMYNNPERWELIKLDVERREELNRDSSLALPGEKKNIPDAKFAEYIFNPKNKSGYAKGQAFESRLGYNIDNWRELKKEIEDNIDVYPATKKGTTKYGDRYEQKMILYGKLNNPANVVVAWLTSHEGTTKMISAYIKEV